MNRLLSASATGRVLGLSTHAVLRLYSDGAIDAEVHEGRLIRFDAEKVRKTLAKRAAKNRGAVKQSNGMIPTL